MRQELFLSELAKTGNLSLACHASEMTRRQVGALRKVDEDFGQAYLEAMDDAVDRLEAEAWRRALDGIEQKLFQAGKLVVDPETNQPIILRRYSDPLLVMLLKGSRPDKYHARGAAAFPLDAAGLIKEIASDDDPPRATSNRC
jgi:hypothetical protein